MCLCLTVVPQVNASAILAWQQQKGPSSTSSAPRTEGQMESGQKCESVVVATVNAKVGVLPSRKASTSVRGNWSHLMLQNPATKTPCRLF